MPYPIRHPVSQNPKCRRPPPPLHCQHVLVGGGECLYHVGGIICQNKLDFFLNDVIIKNIIIHLGNVFSRMPHFKTLATQYYTLHHKMYYEMTSHSKKGPH